MILSPCLFRVIRDGYTEGSSQAVVCALKADLRGPFGDGHGRWVPPTRLGSLGGEKLLGLTAHMIVSKAELAEELGISRPRVSQMIARGLPVRHDDRVDLELACPT
jgi:hypothetical protein